MFKKLILKKNNYMQLKKTELFHIGCFFSDQRLGRTRRAVQRLRWKMFHVYFDFEFFLWIKMYRGLLIPSNSQPISPACCRSTRIFLYRPLGLLFVFSLDSAGPIHNL